MATLKELNIKIGSLKQTQKITSAMKLIATTRFNRMQSIVRKSLEYLEALNAMYGPMKNDNESTSTTSSTSETPSSPSTAPSSKSKDSSDKTIIQFLLFTSDRGLCGSFNSIAIKRFEKLLKEYEGYTCYGDFIGRRGYEYFKSSPLLAKATHLDSFGKHPNYNETLPYADGYLEGFEAGHHTRLVVVYNEFISPISQKPKVRQLLPFVAEDSATPPPSGSDSTQVDSPAKAKMNEESSLFLFEPDRETLIIQYTKEMLRFNVYQILLQSVTGEHAARMTAMDNATRNCDDLIDSSTLERNRVRQAAITTELTEIISGAEAAG